MVADILNPGFELSLRPMKYPVFYEYYLTGMKNFWTEQELALDQDKADLAKLTPAQYRLLKLLIAFFATGDQIVANNACLSLYKHVNSPEYRIWMCKQLQEEATHIATYKMALENFLPDYQDQVEAFSAVNSIETIANKAQICFDVMAAVDQLDELRTDEDKKLFLLNVVCFAAVVEGLFFYGAFAYVFYLRHLGLFHGFAAANTMILRDEAQHYNAAMSLVDIIRRESPRLWDEDLEARIIDMVRQAVDAEADFAQAICEDDLEGLSHQDMRQYLEYVADTRLARLGLPAQWNVTNPFPWMVLQDLQPLTNFFERRVAEYQFGLSGDVSFEEDF